MRKIGILGGTFDPPHNGHIRLAREWGSRLSLDRFLMIPTGTSPHKDAASASAEDRLEMCRMAAEETDGLMEACDFEVKRSGQKSYSVLTLAAMRERYPDSELFMIMGADMFVTLESWYDFDRLRTLATFCTMPREGVTFEQLEAHRLHLRDAGCRGLVADVPRMDVSSTEIRRRISEGLPITGMVPAGVERFIYAKGLYR